MEEFFPGSEIGCFEPGNLFFEDCLSRCLLITSETDKAMLIQAYRVESRRHGSFDDLQPEPVPVGIVQFTGGIEQKQSKEAATELLSHFILLTNHPILGFERWQAELTIVDDESLGTPTYNVSSEGYRIWLLS